jgi:hypothetical protein
MLKMGMVKALWGQQLEAIEKVMDKVTADYKEILSLYDYLDHLLDYWDREYLEDFEAGIVEYRDYLLFLAENK